MRMITYKVRRRPHIKRFIEDFDLDLKGKEEVASAMTSTAFFPVPPSTIELVHPLDGEGPIAGFLEKRGPGLHHICFRSDDIEADIERLKHKGYKFLSESPYPGAHGSKVIFIHPRSCDGVLIELNQPGNED